ncbi:hypothetical protein M5C96_15125 [Acidovorax sp. GBBC 1281]|nr:hypothetical protein [Acidovorax sp. GBBC 1281]WCM95801.1 hypothetical protein M5C96_15125 [Acidovorax sp. GBBC 1281]
MQNVLQRVLQSMEGFGMHRLDTGRIFQRPRHHVWLASCLVGVGLTACGGGSGSTTVALSDALKVDTTYGEAGVATFPLGTPSFASLGVQPDGRLLIAGSRVAVPEAPSGFGSLLATQTFVVRMSADGNVDRGFGQNGEARFSVKGYESISDVRLQADGRILVAVQAHEPCFSPSYQTRCLTASGEPGTWHHTVVGLTANGAVDSTFGTQGIAEGFLSTNFSNLALAIQPDQKPVLLTSNDRPILQVFGRSLRRLSADGIPDAAFNQPTASQPPAPCEASGAAVLALLALRNGSIITAGQLGGRLYADPRSDPGLCVAVHAGATQAQTSGGWTSFGADLEEYQLASHPDGGFVVAARTCAGSDCHLSVAKFSANGALDTSFGDKGIERVALPANYRLKSFFVQSDESMKAFGAIEESAAAGTTARRFRAVWTSLTGNGALANNDTNVATSIQDRPTSAEPREVLRDGAGRWLVISSEEDSARNLVLKVVRTLGTSTGRS